jgi:hypothetical protein
MENSLYSLVLDSFIQYYPTNKEPERIKNTCFPVQEVKPDVLEIVGMKNGLIEDRQEFIEQYVEFGASICKKNLPAFVETNFLGELHKNGKVIISDDFSIVSHSKKKGNIYVATIRNQEYIMKFVPLLYDTDKLKQESYYPLYVLPAWLDAMIHHFLNKDLYALFNIRDQSHCIEYQACLIMKKYDTVMCCLDIDALKEQRDDFVLNMIAQVMFCILLPIKQKYRLCHNDLHSGNIAVKYRGAKAKYVRLLLEKTQEELQHYNKEKKSITLKIPTEVCEYFLIDYEGSSVDYPCIDDDPVSMITTKELDFGLEHDPSNTYTDIVQFLYYFLYLEMSREDYQFNKEVLEDMLFKKQYYMLFKPSSKEQVLKSMDRYRILYEHGSKFLTWKSISLVPFVHYFASIFSIPEDQVPTGQDVIQIDIDALA